MSKGLHFGIKETRKSNFRLEDFRIGLFVIPS